MSSALSVTPENTKPQKSVLTVLSDWFHEQPQSVQILTVGSIVTLGTFMSLRFIRHLWASQRLDLTGKVIIITGCDSGFGRTLAIQLDDMGSYVFAFCLKPENARELDRITSSRCQTLVVELMNSEHIQRAREVVSDFCESHSKRVWGLVNNARVSCMGPFELVDEREWEKQIEINLNGVGRTTRAFFPLMGTDGNERSNVAAQRSDMHFLSNLLRCAEHGRIVNMSSLAARVPLPLLSGYSASNAAVSALSDSLRYEISPAFGVWVCSIEPSFYNTSVIVNNNPDNHAHKTMEAFVNDPLLWSLYGGERKIFQIMADDINDKFVHDDEEDEQRVVESLVHALSSVAPYARYEVSTTGKYLGLAHFVYPVFFLWRATWRFLKGPVRNPVWRSHSFKDFGSRNRRDSNSGWNDADAMIQM